MTLNPWHAVNRRLFHANFPKIFKRAILAEHLSKAASVIPLNYHVSDTGKKDKMFFRKQFIYFCT